MMPCCIDEKKEGHKEGRKPIMKEVKQENGEGVKWKTRKEAMKERREMKVRKKEGSKEVKKDRLNRAKEDGRMERGKD